VANNFTLSLSVAVFASTFDVHFPPFQTVSKQYTILTLAGVLISVNFGICVLKYSAVFAQCLKQEDGGERRKKQACFKNSCSQSDNLSFWMLQHCSSGVHYIEMLIPLIQKCKVE
jgi:hypothetical protein